MTYAALVEARKSCTACIGVVNASRLSGGIYDSNHIGPWTRWLGDLNAEIMVVGQDWGDQRAFETQQGANGAYSATNDALRELLASIGFDVPTPQEPSVFSRVFLTNAVLCFKDHGCQGPVQSEWFQNCGRKFLRPQIELLRPKAVVCLGQRAFNAVLAAFELPPQKSFRLAVEDRGTPLPNGSYAFAVYHCGRRILNSHRARQAQFRDWQRIKSAL